MALKFEAPRGVPDYFPPYSKLFDYIRSTFTRNAQKFGFELMELPVFEDTDLYLRGVGRSTDIVSKEMYTFKDKGDRSVTLRPEGTAGIMRSVLEHGLDRKTLPIKLYYSGPFFRYERPQKGRYRQLQQFGVEAIGQIDPYLDVEVIHLADSTFKQLKLANYELHITSLGGPETRQKYRHALVEYLDKFDLDGETRERIKLNPLRILDDKRPEIKQIISEAPILTSYLNREERDDFEQVLSGLKALNISYVLNNHLVRGLDYYTKTTFEFVSPNLGAQSGIGGGGRYDNLMQELGGKSELSGIGFGIGLDRVFLALQDQVDIQATTFVFGIGLDQRSKQDIFVIISKLRELGIAAIFSFGERSLKSALKQAEKFSPKFILLPDLNSKYTQFILRNSATREEEVFSAEKLIDYLVDEAR